MRALIAALSLVVGTLLSSATIAGPTETVPIPYSLADANRGAELRSEASILIPLIFDPCGSSPAMSDTINRYRRFKSNLENMQMHLDLAIARADYDYAMSLVDIYCPEPSTEEEQEEALARKKTQIMLANSVLDRMDALVEPKTSQED